MPTYTIAGKTVLITGAAGGIGAAAARALQARGANVALADLGPGAASALARELGGDRALALTVDVTDTAALADAVDRTTGRFGSLDVVFANAGIAADPPATMATIDEATFERVVEVDLLGVWRTVRAALPHVIAARTWQPDRSRLRQQGLPGCLRRGSRRRWPRRSQGPDRRSRRARPRRPAPGLLPGRSRFRRR